MTASSPSPKRNRGFSLVELAIVMVIVSLLAGGLIVSLSAQMELANTAETQRRLADARLALLGYAAANGRLPCPAAPDSTGVESPSGGGACTNPWNGFLPAITLGLGPSNGAGYAVDAWGNPIRYAVTTVKHATYCASGCFTTTDGVKALWNALGVASLSGTYEPDLQVCTSATGLTGSGASATCASGQTLSNNAVAVIFSQGRNGGGTPTSTDELANSPSVATSLDRLFVSHTPTPAGSGEFDDLVIWLSPNQLFSQMLSAGRLP